MQNHVNLVDLVKSFPTSIFFAKFGFDTAENESLKVCLISFKFQVMGFNIHIGTPPCRGTANSLGVRLGQLHRTLRAESGVRAAEGRGAERPLPAQGCTRDEKLCALKGRRVEGIGLEKN